MSIPDGTGPGPRPLATVAVTAVLLVGLQAAGRGLLAPPDAWSVDGIRAWTSQRGGAAAAMAGLRLIAIGLGWYVLALTLAGAIASMTRCRPLALLAERAMPASLRRLLVGMAGASTASVTLLTAPGATAAMAYTATAPGTPAAWSHGWATGPEPAGDAPAGLAVLRRLPIDEAGTVPSEGDRPGPPATTAAIGPPAVLRLLPAAPTDPVVGPTPAAPSDDDTERYVVEAGDSFWSIAVDHLGEVTATAPDEAAVARYWARLIDANRAILHDRSNPDLLFVGQALVLPPVG
ncbi:MAG: LysM peptidoglycan-binding domain-containing protein [Acidimicrobiia bacterium]